MTKFLALISGKGGAGKTTTALNLGHALTKLNKKTIVLDANFATPNLALHLGVTSPNATLNEFLKKKKGLHEIIHLHPSGLAFIPSSVSYQDFKKARPDKITGVFEHLDGMADFILVDCPAGLGYDLAKILNNTDEALIIVNPHLSSLIDAVKSIEIAKENNNSVPGFILNMTHGKNEITINNIEQTLNMPLIANVPFDKKIKKALYKQSPSHYLYPRSKSSKQFLKVAEYLIKEKS